MVATLVALLANIDTTTALKAFIAVLRAQALRYNINFDAGVGVKDVEAGSKEINKFLFPPLSTSFSFQNNCIIWDTLSFYIDVALTLW